MTGRVGSSATIRVDRRARAVDDLGRSGHAPTDDHVGMFSDIERERMIAALGQALHLADAIGASRLRELVDWVADHLGIDPARLPTVADELIRVGLTTRERDVWRRIVAGRSNKEIGADLGISEKTAEIHVSSVLRKLGVTCRVEAATRGIMLGFGADASQSQPRLTGNLAV